MSLGRIALPLFMSLEPCPRLSLSSTPPFDPPGFTHAKMDCFAGATSLFSQAREGNKGLEVPERQVRTAVKCWVSKPGTKGSFAKLFDSLEFLRWYWHSK